MKFSMTKPYPSILWIPVAIVTIFNFITSNSSVNADDKLLSIEQQSEIQILIREYILDHPEIIIESIQKMEARKKQKSTEQRKKTLIAMRDQLTKDPSSPLAGNPNGDVSIVEFFDYRCGYCKTTTPAILKILKEDPNVRLVFKELPILGPESVTAARAALAAWNIDSAKYPKFHFALMENRGQLSRTKIMAIASKIGLNISDLKAAMQAPNIQKAIEKNWQLANALNIKGTPAFIIDGEIVPGAINFATIKRLIAKARKS